MNSMVNLVNQVFEIEQKIINKGDMVDISRNLERVKNHLDELGFNYHSPLHERYADTRTDCVASIVGELNENSMYITKVIKPVVFQTHASGNKSIIQKAVVIVESRK